MANNSFDPHSWITKDGVRHSIRDMEDRHIFSTLKFLYSLGEDEIRLGLIRLADDLDRTGTSPDLALKFRKISTSGTLREARITYTPQIPHLEAEAEIRGIKGWRYSMSDVEVHKSLGAVLENASKIIKVFDSVSHNPNVPVKSEIVKMKRAMVNLERSGYRLESCPK